MANKPNPMLAKIEAKYAAEYQMKLAIAESDFQAMIKMAIQQCSDAALMALDDVVEVTPDIAKQFHIAHTKYVNEISNMVVNEDDDPELVWSKATIDKRLKQIVGEENFADWDTRYGGKENG